MPHPCQIPEEKVPKSPEARFESYACISGTSEELIQRLNIEWIAFEDDGLGEARVACFLTASGCCFGLKYHLQSPRNDLTTLILPVDDPSAHFETAMEALLFSSQDLRWISDKIHLTNYALFREDDNGVRFHIRDFACRADALACSRGLAQGGHKQHYFTEPLQRPVVRLEFSPELREPPCVVPL